MTTEIETKIELSEESFRHLLNRCRVLRREDQLNVYYDSSGCLANRAATFRLRYKKGGRPVWTLKLPLKQQEGTRTAIEIEETIICFAFPMRTVIIERDLTEDLRVYFERMGVFRLDRVGAMRTRRITVELPHGVPLDLDEVKLPDGSIFFEAEIESDDIEAHASALHDIRSIIPHFHMSYLSKFQRFVKAIALLQERPAKVRTDRS